MLIFSKFQRRSNREKRVYPIVPMREEPAQRASPNAQIVTKQKSLLKFNLQRRYPRLRECVVVTVSLSCYWWYLAIHKFPTQARYPNASPRDWEEINVIGIPLLLTLSSRLLADLTQSSPATRVRVEGNTDHLRSPNSNEKLGITRPNAVRDFLMKYGVSSDQITMAARAKGYKKPIVRQMLRAG
jgi:hypothetical protein